MSFLNTLGSFMSGWGGQAISLIGTGLDVYGQYKSGQQAYEAAEYNAELEAFNTEQQLRIHRERVKRTVAKQRASASAAGVRSGSGSPLALRLETLEQGAVDEYYIKRGGELRQAARIYSGESARSASRIGAVSAGFQGLADYAKVYGR